ncbi:MAG: DUF2271 domain-containing protein [Hyphomicrobiaceae bacterium]
MSAPAGAAELEVNIEIPQLDVVEYHRPYVAIWLEPADRTAAKTLSVWYEVANRKKEGDKWLKDLRQWWRRAGRDMKVPADGITGATKPVGKHAVRLDPTNKVLAELVPGDYEVVVEAAREVGGREIVRLPLKWPAEAPVLTEVRGKEELGSVSLKVTP